jgi:hypothetical protein
MHTDVRTSNFVTEPGADCSIHATCPPPSLSNRAVARFPQRVTSHYVCIAMPRAAAQATA